MPIDMGSISALAASLQSAVEIARVMKGLQDASAIQSKVIELQGVIMSAQANALAAQTDQFALLNRVRDLEQEMAAMGEWHTEKQRYELRQVDRGAFAYVLRSEMQGAEPPHWLCASCFQNSKKRILQYRERDRGERRPSYRCPDCSAEIKVHDDNAPDSAWG